MDRTIFIYANQAETSRKIAAECKEKLLHAGLRVTDQLTRDTDLIICIGGDGTFLELIHAYDFPQTPIIGINTGHLGFFQDLLPTQIDQFIEYYLHHLDHLQVVSTVECSIWAGHEIYKMTGINEMVVKGELGAIIHLNVFFGDAMIERFSGDGILVSTPAGSTAYNYSIGGSIVDPHLELLQMTPIAPMNTTVYRSFTSSLILPSNQLLTLIPDMRQDPYINIQSDGFIREFNDVKKITIGYSTKKIHLVKFSGYEFWTKVKEKFLIGNADGSTEQDLK
ncbi:NAD+ kinase [Eubacterium pyruvativorans]|uniref:NAD kinase n=1 Tax=Eubacterium pyruvativorans TaxID=155865 RepID=A0A1I7F091_9FIRM|nr:NAD(+)/NADH kinase [Eubacterium pyruvativorans]MDO5567886.1 NAD(+)/NADH kinase [Eubacteriales bacterium]HAT82362.1 NAD(+) kinase [Eubacterium sp.]MCI5747112.1 NAD(+)/NADH kinase [Eubacterium pyruvativorans]MDD6707652.1 NAD(+)/NADH kinase [Eubacterium pyruvativorans]MDD7684577.1 NAD(+)/NADH kinase [Eubacterium pyruvativorans]